MAVATDAVDAAVGTTVAAGATDAATEGLGLGMGVGDGRVLTDGLAAGVGATDVLTSGVAVAAAAAGALGVGLGFTLGELAGVALTAAAAVALGVDAIIGAARRTPAPGTSGRRNWTTRGTRSHRDRWQPRSHSTPSSSSPTCYLCAAARYAATWKPRSPKWHGGRLSSNPERHRPYHPAPPGSGRLPSVQPNQNLGTHLTRCQRHHNEANPCWPTGT